MPWLTGTAQWPFKDFSTPVRPDNPVPYMNQKGVVERDFTKKEVFYVYQSYWTDKPMAHIYGHSWPVRWGEPGEDKMIKVYSNCDEAELFLNGKSQGVKLRNSQDFPAAGLRWNLNFIAGENDVKVIARKGKVTVTDSKSFRYETAKWSVPARMMLTKIEDRDGIQTLEARIVDENNVPCLDARNWVRFSLSGDGELIENQGTSSGSSFLQMYNGRAIIRVKSTKGKYVIAVKSEGIPTVSLNL
jgi:beta-galactosidase